MNIEPPRASTPAKAPASVPGKTLAKDMPLFKTNPLPTRSFPGVRTPSPKGGSTHFTPISREEVNGLLDRIENLERYTLEVCQLLRTGFRDLEHRVGFLEGDPASAYRDQGQDEKWPELFPQGRTKGIKNTAPSHTKGPPADRPRSATPTQRNHSPGRQQALQEYETYNGTFGEDPSIYGPSNWEYTTSPSGMDGRPYDEYHEAGDELRNITSPSPALLSNRPDFDSSDSLTTLSNQNPYNRPTPFGRRQTVGPYHTSETSSNEEIEPPQPLVRRQTTWGDNRRNPFIEPRPPSPIHRRQTLWPNSSNPITEKPITEKSGNLEDVDLGKKEEQSRDSSSWKWLGYMPKALGGSKGTGGDESEKRFVKPEDLEMGGKMEGMEKEGTVVDGRELC